MKRAMKPDVMGMIPVGLMRQRAEQWRYIEDGGVDANNHPTGQWRRVGSLSCFINGLSGATAEHARQLVHQATHEVIYNQGPQLELKDQIRYNGRVFDVGHIRDVEFRGRQFVLTVQEVQSTQ